jgi:hypothetical protein
MPSFGSRNHSIFRISIILVVCVLAAVETSYADGCAPGGPQATYQFVGQCTDCSGTGVGVLTVRNYTLGDTLDSCNLVSFTYTSNLTSFTITPSGSYNLGGTLPASLPSAASVRVFGTGRNNFESTTGGAWCAGAGCVGDIGTSSTWGYPPSPSTAPTLSPAALGALVLLLAGAGALLVRRRARGSAGA